MKFLYGLFVSILVLLSLPVMAVIAGIAFIAHGLPIIFCQKRIGKDGTPFVMYKFRTMVRDAEVRKKSLVSKNEANGPVFKIRKDPRFTPFGRFVSHTGLDELPQLFNVLKGDMALIGPRPLPVSEAAKLTKRQAVRHGIKPGIISPWILNGYHNNTFESWMDSDIAYIRKKSVWYDFQLSVRTLKLLFRLFERELRA